MDSWARRPPSLGAEPHQTDLYNRLVGLAPLAAWVLLGIRGSEPPVTLGMTCTIVGLVYKLPPHFSVV
jgi:hypothetical protein